MALDAKLETAHDSASGQRPPQSRARQAAILILSLGLCAFQIFILLWPQAPLMERPIHLSLALALMFLVSPLAHARLSRRFGRGLDLAGLAAAVALAGYYVVAQERLNTRIEVVDPVLTVDVVFGLILILLLLEGVRRIVGWSLLGFILVVFLYNFGGAFFPGWAWFRGFGLKETIEILTMTTNGIQGVTTQTSVQFIFYFILFGAMYGAIGGGQLFIDIGLAVSGRFRGGAAKAAVISSALMGTISGSAVANVASVGVFTIPLMRKAGYLAEEAGAIEAISSTGGQLMPPVMGVAAFVLAEILQIDYGKVALAAAIPAIAFYISLFFVVDLMARRHNIGTLSAEYFATRAPILPRLFLLTPPLVLVAFLAAGRSATWSVNAAIVACVATSYFRRQSWLSLAGWKRAILDAAGQASQVAVPIAAIGIIIAIATQSNLALKFSTNLMATGAHNIYAAMALTIIGCIIMGMGLPTVAAYIIGAILFAPVLIKLGIAPLAAHLFVMYYCVLSMVTPPVALAAYAAAGLAGSDTMRTGWRAFHLSVVSFLIPFGFAFDSHILGQGNPGMILLGFLSLVAATASWAVALVGYWRDHLSIAVRVLLGALSVAVILFPTGSRGWTASILLLALCATWVFLRGRRAVQKVTRSAQA